jgi:predicted esterase
LWPAYPDSEDLNWCRVWGYGEEKDQIRGLAQSLEYIQDTLERKGPFIGIVGFSSGAAMAALVTSILEKGEPICGLSRKV